MKNVGPHFVVVFARNSVASSTAPAILAHSTPMATTAVDANGLEGSCTQSTPGRGFTAAYAVVSVPKSLQVEAHIDHDLSSASETVHSPCSGCSVVTCVQCCLQPALWGRTPGGT